MEFKIEKGIPIPPGKKIYPWPEMEIGDSFTVSITNGDLSRARKRLSSAAVHHQKKHGGRFTVRKIDDNTLRVWRVE